MNEDEFLEQARAEAERRWPGPNIVMPNGWHEKGMASGFVLGALWAARQEPSLKAEALREASRSCIDATMSLWLHDRANWIEKGSSDE